MIAFDFEMIGAKLLERQFEDVTGSNSFLYLTVDAQRLVMVRFFLPGRRYLDVEGYFMKIRF